MTDPLCADGIHEAEGGCCPVRDAEIAVLDAHGHTQLRAERDDTATRLERIAEAHDKEVDEHGGVSGYCGECEHPWPCPTYRWATAPTVDINCTWGLDDCAFDHDHDAPEAQSALAMPVTYRRIKPRAVVIWCPRHQLGEHIDGCPDEAAR